MLYFNAHQYDFWKIYKSIQHFYPLGIPKNETGMYLSYPGQQELEALLVQHIHHEAQYKARWLDFTHDLQQKIRNPIIETTFGQAPCFSASVLLEEVSAGNLTIRKELCFFVSLLGPYYTVVGQQLSEVRLEENCFRSTNYLVVSPEKEFAEGFRFLCEKIEERFQQYRFVPFEICRQTIAGLEVRYTDAPLQAIFNALFRDGIDLNTQVLGDKYYKAENWVKADYVADEGNWEIHSPD